ncbi:TPA: hypothetical protein NU497_004162 [Escherichia coli]|nr:hypothetical protein [Escherichia coli]
MSIKGPMDLILRETARKSGWYNDNNQPRLRDIDARLNMRRAGHQAIGSYLKGEKEPRLENLAIMLDLFKVAAIMPLKDGSWLVCEPCGGADLVSENKELRAQVAQLENQIDELTAMLKEMNRINADLEKSLQTTENTDEKVDEKVDEKRVSRKRNPKPQLFTIADLKHALIENGGTLKGHNADIAFAMALNYSDIATRRVETLQPSIPLVSRLVKAASEAGIIHVTSEGSQGPKTLTVLQR